jgi:phosphoglycerol transferase MdoB-like AlkP superfamily enzyme
MVIKSRFGPLYLAGALLVLVSMVVRTILLLKALPNIDLTIGLVAKVYTAGLFYDCITFFYGAVPLVVYTVLVPDRLFNHRFHRPLVYAGFFIITCILIFEAAAEYLFFDEFGTRFNFIAVDYLVYTREVMGNIRESYPIVPILGGALLLAALIFFAFKKRIDMSFNGTTRMKQRLRTGAFFIAVPVLSFAFVTLAFTSISKNSFANELAGNGIYDLFAAFRNSELDFSKFYVTRDDETVLTSLRKQLRERNDRLTSGDVHSIARQIANKGEEMRLNIIVVVEESMSAAYLGAFGSNEGLTPNLDRLSRESLFFTHLYATGTRTVRGLEAITLSLPPLPGVSIVKRPNNGGLFSWGTVMKEKGYDVKYIYAGYGYFDNMNAFFSGNGFDIVDRGSFTRDEVTFSNIWGVCDEDLFNKVIHEADKSHIAGKPFFSMVMTTSNHRPFTYPEGRIDIPSQTGRDGGIKYADYAVGKFISDARKQPWFDNTIFVIVADHCAGSAGKTELPVKKYEIPLFVYAPSHIKPRRIDRVASQIDIAPTVLGLLNFRYTSKFMGHDILRMDSAQERAFISTYQKLGFIEDGELIVLGPQRYLKAYAIDLKSGTAVESKPRDKIVADALGYFQGASYVYTRGLNSLAASDPR